MRCLLIAGTVLLLAGCGSDEAASGGLAALTVRVDDGAGAPRELQLECAQPTDSSACGAAAGVSAADLAPTPEDTMCTQIYGGPEKATIKGTLRGETIDAAFNRTNGCEIDRWERVQPLLDEVR
ncbi:MAG TPA: hypothetical protein VNS09_15000 [Solirubrobacter sp.]|nr:hypothetical protein [Solirubrobacter sp.]